MRTLTVFFLACAAYGAITVKHANGDPDSSYAEDQLQNAIDDPDTTCGDIIEIDPGASRHGSGYKLRGPALAPTLGGPAYPPSYAKDCAKPYPGSSRTALKFNGTSSYVVTPAISVGATFSVSVWVNSKSTLQGAYTRVAETQFGDGFFLGADSTGTRYQWIVNRGTGSTGSCGVLYGCTVGGAVVYGWHLLTGTYDGSVGKLYFDGVLVSADTYTAPATTNHPLYVGRTYSGGGFWSGGIDDVRLYNRALSGAEVSAIFADSGISSTGLIGHWPFDEVSGTTAHDTSGAGHDGVITSATPILPKAPIPAGRYITIRSSKTNQLTPGQRVGAADAANLAFVGNLTFGGGIGCTVFETEWAANYWKLQGLEIAATPVPVTDNGPPNYEPQAPYYYGCSEGAKAPVKIGYALKATGHSGHSRMDNFPHHIVLDQVWIHGLDGYRIRDGAQIEGISIDVVNSTIDNIHCPSHCGQESHAIITVNGRGPLRLVNNKFEAGQNNLMFGGAVSVNKRPMEDVTIINNWFYRPWKWMDWSYTTDPTPLSPCPVDPDGHGATYLNTTTGTYWECQGAKPGMWTVIDAATYTALITARQSGEGKNIMEFKSVRRMLFRGNVMEGGTALSESGQNGSCWLLSICSGPQSVASHILFENNHCHNGGWALNQGADISWLNPDNETEYWDNGGRAIHHVLMRNNLFTRMSEDMVNAPSFAAYGRFGNQPSGFAQIGHGKAEAVTADHNTFESRATQGNSMWNTAVRTGQTADLAINQRVSNNIFTAGKSPLTAIDGVHGTNRNAVAATWGPYSEMTNNGILDNLGIGITSSFFDAMRFHCDPGTTGCRYQSNYDQPPPNCLGCKSMVPAAGGFVNFPDDLTLQPTSPFKAAGLDGKDLGADLNVVTWETAGAVTGTVIPYSVMKIRSILPAATSVQVRFSAIDTSSCTVEARKYGFPLSTPVATATANTGTLDRLVTLNGLTAAKRYALKVTCAGSYYREDEFRTP